MKRKIGKFKEILACLFLVLGCMSTVVAQNSNVQNSESGVVVQSADESADSLDIYLLTCQPHDEVYSVYGHTAIRVCDKSRNLDMVVNYGIFDFSTDNFILKFIFGQTDYKMGVQSMERFCNEYRYYGSGVWQQHLNLLPSEKIAFMSAILENSKPENVVYRYNFLYNNCSTKARDIILGAIKQGRVEFTDSLPVEYQGTFRQLVRKANVEHQWTSMGIDYLLGVKADMPLNRDERHFLPDYLKYDFENAQIVTESGECRPLVDSSGWVILAGIPYKSDYPSIAECPPILLFVTYALIVVIALLIQLLCLKRPLRWLNYAFIVPYGLIGVVLTCMLFSEHPTVNVNLQILLLNPLFLYLGFPVKRKFNWSYKVMIVFVVLFLLGNAIQSYATGANLMALTLLLLLVANTYAFGYGKAKTQKKEV